MREKKFFIKRHYVHINPITKLVFLTPCYQHFKNDGTKAGVDIFSNKKKRIKLVNDKVINIRTLGRYDTFCPHCKQPLRLP